MALRKPVFNVPGGYQQIAPTDQIAVDASVMTATATGASGSRALSDAFAFAAGNVASIAALRTLATAPLQSGVVVVVSGYYAAADNGGGPFAWAPTSTASDDGGAVIRPTAIASGSPGRWLRQFPGGRKSVRYWGATGDGSGTGDQAGFVNAVAYVNTGTSNSGDIILIPPGTYKFTATFAPTTLEPFNVAGYTFQGAGQHNTILDFSGLPANSDGLVLTGIGVKVRDLKVVGAPRDNIVMSNFKHGEISHVRTQGAGRDGLRVTDSYMVTLADIWSMNNGANGFTIGIVGGGGVASGYNTSIDGHSLYGYMNGSGRGFAVNNTSYSSFTACGSDLNDFGWVFYNVSGVALLGCGAESNKQDGFYTAASTAIASGATTPDITGLTFTGCFGYSNGTANSGANNFLYAGSFDGKQVKVAIVGGADLLLTNSVTRSVTVTGTAADVSDITSSYVGTTTFSAGAVQSGVARTGPWTQYTPTVATTGGTINTGTSTARWSRTGKTINVAAFVPVTSVSSGTGAVTVSLPVPAVASGVQTGSGRDTNTGGMLQAYVGGSGTVLNIQKPDGSYPAAAGSNLAVSLAYEAQ